MNLAVLFFAGFYGVACYREKLPASTAAYQTRWGQRFFDIAIEFSFFLNNINRYLIFREYFLP